MKTFLITIMMLVAVACTPNLEESQQLGRKPDARVWHDAPPAPVDSPSPGAVGWTSCYTSGNPSAACNVSTQFCCFDSINIPHNGWCVNNPASFPTDTCPHSWSRCDGNEDCPSGQRCNEHFGPAVFYEGNAVTIECKSTWDAGDHQLCHGAGDTSCPSGTTCTQGNTLYGEMPPTMYICS